MVHKITWTPLAVNTYINTVDYLEKEWPGKERGKFIDLVQRKIKSLSIHPQLGKRSNKRLDLRQVVINKRILLVYRYKPSKGELELVCFFNTYRDPKSLLTDLSK